VKISKRYLLLISSAPLPRLIVELTEVYCYGVAGILGNCGCISVVVLDAAVA